MTKNQPLLKSREYNFQTKNYKSWKSGKSWLYSASVLLSLTGGALAVAVTLPSQVAKADTPIKEALINPKVAFASDALAPPAVVSSDSLVSVDSVDAHNLDAGLATIAQGSAPSGSTVSSVLSVQPLYYYAVSPAASQASQSVGSASASVSLVNAAPIDDLLSEMTSSLTTRVDSLLSRTVPDLQTPQKQTLAVAAVIPSMNLTASSAALQSVDFISLSKFDNGNFASLTPEMLYWLAREQDDKYNDGSDTDKVGDVVYAGPDGTGPTFKVVAVVNSIDPSSNYPSNGFQAAAFAPLINGEADLTKIVISYPGINFRYQKIGTTETDTAKDVLTSIESVIGGETIYTDGLQVAAGQTASAVKFASSVKNDFPDAHILLTGLSLGGYLALSAGAQLELPAYTYSAQDPANSLSASQLKFIQTHHDMYVNNRNSYDLILGHFGGNITGTAVYFDGLGPLDADAHYAPFSFSAAGDISDPISNLVGPTLNSLVSLVDPAASVAGKFGTWLISTWAESGKPVLIDSANQIAAGIVDMLWGGAHHSDFNLFMSSALKIAEAAANGVYYSIFE